MVLGSAGEAVHHLHGRRETLLVRLSRQPRKLAVHHDVIAAPGQHQFAILDLDHRHASMRGSDLQFSAGQ